MSTVLNRLLDSQNLAQIVPENKGEVVVVGSDANSTYLLIAAGLGIVIVLTIIIIIVRHHKRRLRYRS
jgi:hypothetical protein